METGVFILTGKYLLKIGLLSGLVLGINHGLNYIHSVKIEKIRSKINSKKESVEDDSYINDLRKKLESRG
jgi:hypothetical protein